VQLGSVPEFHRSRHRGTIDRCRGRSDAISRVATREVSGLDGPIVRATVGRGLELDPGDETEIACTGARSGWPVAGPMTGLVGNPRHDGSDGRRAKSRAAVTSS
jgi:hypothetical protein